MDKKNCEPKKMLKSNFGQKTLGRTELPNQIIELKEI